MASEETSAPANPFLRVLRGLLRPLVKAMIAQGVTVPAVYRLLKEVYVEVAESDFALGDRRPTDSRISVLTGVHRKDVRAIREEGRPEASAAQRRVTAIASVIGRWLASPETTDAEGRPAPLPRQSGGSDGPSFDALVASVSKDVRPRTVLDELVRQRLVALDPGTDMVTLRAEAFLGPADSEQKILFFAQNVGDHIAAATENLLAEGGEAPFMERAVFYNRLLPASVDAVETVARAQAAETLATLNRMAYARQQADLEAAGPTERFRFGVYFYRAPDGAAEAPGIEREDAGPAGPTEAGSTEGRDGSR